MSDRRTEQQDELLANIKRDLAHLVEVRDSIARWTDAHVMYRFYHQSFKVYSGQAATLRIVDTLHALAPQGTEFTEWFNDIVWAGTGREFELAHNREWFVQTAPIVAAYLHVRWLLDEAIRCASLPATPEWLPEGWATLLSIYGIR